MSSPYGHAQIIINRFHIIQLAMKAVQSTRFTLQLIFGLSPKFKQDYKIYQFVLRVQRSRSFDELPEILSQ